MSGRIVVVGDSEAVFGLGLLGLTGFAVADAESARQALEQASSDPSIAVVLVTENWRDVRREIEPAPANGSGPLIIEIPSAHPGARENTLREQMRRILGTTLEP